MASVRAQMYVRVRHTRAGYAPSAQRHNGGSRAAPGDARGCFSPRPPSRDAQPRVVQNPSSGAALGPWDRFQAPVGDPLAADDRAPVGPLREALFGALDRGELLAQGFREREVDPLFDQRRSVLGGLGVDGVVDRPLWFAELGEVAASTRLGGSTESSSRACSGSRTSSMNGPPGEAEPSSRAARDRVRSKRASGSDSSARTRTEMTAPSNSAGTASWLISFSIGIPIDIASTTVANSSPCVLRFARRRRRPRSPRRERSNTYPERLQPGAVAARADARLAALNTHSSTNSWKRRGSSSLSHPA